MTSCLFFLWFARAHVPFQSDRACLPAPTQPCQEYEEQCSDAGTQNTDNSSARSATDAATCRGLDNAVNVLQKLSESASKAAEASASASLDMSFSAIVVAFASYAVIA